MTNWKLAASDWVAGATATREPIEQDLGEALRADSLTVGLRGGDIAAAMREAAAAKDSAAALDALRSRLAVRVPILESDGWSEPAAERKRLLGGGWLPAGRVGLLTGQGGGGKSRLALQLACAIAAPREGAARWRPDADSTMWLPGAIGCDLLAHGAAVIASWEDELREVARRRHWMWNETGARLAWSRPAGRDDRLVVADMRELGPAWGPDPGAHVSTTGGWTDVGRWLLRLCESRRARLLVLDPLAAAFAGNENDRGLVRAFMASLDGWASRTGCAVMIVAHPSKSEAGAGSIYSGSTDWHNAARWLWSLRREERGAGATDRDEWKLELVKSNYGRLAHLWLRGLPAVGRDGEGRGWDGWEAFKPTTSRGRIAGATIPAGGDPLDVFG